MRLGIAALLCLVTLPAYGQAFGTYAGMKVEEFPSAEQNLKFAQHFEVTVPVPNPNMTGYRATIGPNIGLCEVSGTGFWGSQPEARHLALIDALSRIYGPATEGSQSLRRWKVPGMNVSVVWNRDTSSSTLKYTFRDTDDCRVDAMAAATSTTGL